ncbi:MAG: NACHT domain-containing protein, partial [Planktothrix sp.]
SARVVLTCRVNVWEANLNALEAFETYRMLNFKYPTQVEAFIGKWFESSDPTKGEALRQELAKAEYQRLQDLVKNPLRLTLLCSTWQISEGLPETQAELYKKFVGKIYQWKQNHFPTTEQQRQQLNYALGELARRGIDDAASPFRLRHQLVTEVLGDCDEDMSLFALALRLGWLNQVGVAAEDNSEKVYAFYHATFQEYFAALSLEDWDFFLPENHRDRRVPGNLYRIFDPLWKQTILLWLGRKNVQKEQKEEFIARLVKFEDGCGEWENRDKCDRGFYEYRAYFLAAAGIAEFKECTLGDEILKNLVKYAFCLNCKTEDDLRIFLSPNSQSAKNCIKENINQKLILDELKSLLDSSTNYRQWLVAAITGKIESFYEYSRDALVEIIKNNDTDEFLIILAAHALWEIDPSNVEAIPRLEKLIKDSDNEDIPMQAKYILGIIAPDHPEAIVNSENSEFGSNEETEVLESGDILHPDVIKNMVQKISDSSIDEDSRWQAAESLAEPANANKDAITQLENLLQESNLRLTITIASYALGKIDSGNLQAVSLLVKNLQNCNDESERWEVADSLNKILKTDKQRNQVINLLKGKLDEDTYEKDVKLFLDYYEVIWHCAQNLSYPVFYRAWHGEEDEVEPEAVSNLPQRLHAKLEEMGLSSSLQLICIDGSK